MLPLHSLPERGAMPDRPGGRGQSTRPTRQGRNADEVRAERHRKKLVPSGPPRPDHSREHFSAVARAARTARRTGVAVHPADPPVALAALDAVFLAEGKDGGRRIPARSFNVLPSEDPAGHSVLRHGELIVGIEIGGAAPKSAYLKDPRAGEL